MLEIQRLIELLKSDNHNMRYDACEQLRVWRQPLPQEAIDALAETTNDANADVADAAQRALSLHRSRSLQDAEQLTSDTVDPKPYWQDFIGTSGGIVLVLLACIAIFLLTFYFFFFFSCWGSGTC